jgi:hypothetical protein
MMEMRINTSRNKNVSCLFLVLIIIPLLVIQGCSSYTIADMGSGYNAFTWKSGPNQYSFEIKSNYKVISKNLSDTASDVFFINPEATNNKIVTQIMVSNSKLEAGENSYSEAMDRSLSHLNEPEFRILERFPVNVLGNPGEEVIYSYKRIFEDSRIAPVPSISRELMFTRDQRLWWFSIDSPESSDESAKSDFEHLIQTFKILE